ncbi:MAG: hypothetical protein K6B70_01665 [Clostridia bacterium]|nr:hypothetical protein [Clostridia bacterium]
MNFQKIIKDIKKIDKKIMDIVKSGLKISFILCLIAIFVLGTYLTIGEPHAFYIGIALFKSGLYYIIGCVIFGFYFNKIK